jgi:hypothetical protein
MNSRLTLLACLIMAAFLIAAGCVQSANSGAAPLTTTVVTTTTFPYPVQSFSPGGPSAASANCRQGLTACGGSCNDLAVDIGNCGACGSTCPDNSACKNGQCLCKDGYGNCNGKCINIDSDVKNCGECGNICPAGQVCTSGVCGVICNSGQVSCSGTCVNLKSDAGNCGSCGITCPDGQECSNGQCRVTCSGGLTYCDTCRDLMTDTSNCGACGNSCGTGFFCLNGFCTISGGTSMRSSTGQQAGGSCASFETSCSGVCKNLRADSSNCGACGNTCSCPTSSAPGYSCTGASCGNGQCVVWCQKNGAGLTGSTAYLSSDPNNCGKCGNKCLSTQTCTFGVCLGKMQKNF